MKRAKSLIIDHSILTTSSNYLINIKNEAYRNNLANAYVKKDLPAIAHAERISFSKHQHEILI